MHPHTTEAIQDFIRTLSRVEVRRALAADHLGAAFLSVHSEKCDGAAHLDYRGQDGNTAAVTYCHACDGSGRRCTADESEQRWQLFDVFLCRAGFYFRAQEHKAAVAAQEAAQLPLALEAAR